MYMYICVYAHMHVTSYIYMYSMYIPDVRSFYPVYFSVNHNLTLYSSIWAVMYAQKDKQSAHMSGITVTRS